MTDDFPWHRHYPPGVPETLPYPDLPLFRLLEKSAAESPHRIFTNFKGARRTYAEIDQASDQLAAGLASLGVKKGGRIGLLLPNTPQFVIGLFAAHKLGAITAAFSPGLDADVLERQMGMTGVETLLVMANQYEWAKAFQPRTRIRSIIAVNIKDDLSPAPAFLFNLLREKKDGYRIEPEPGDYWMADLIDRHTPEERPEVPVSPEDPALFQFSKGSTGAPKAVTILHRSLMANALQYQAWLQPSLAENPWIIPALSLAHPHGLVGGVGLPIVSAGTLILTTQSSEAFELASRRSGAVVVSRAETLPSGNQMPEIKSSKTHTQLPTIHLATGPAADETRKTFQNRTDLMLAEVYGLVEMTWAAAIQPVSSGVSARRGLLPLPDVEARIVSPADRLRVLPPGETGELVLRGPQMIHQYPGQPTENYRSMRDGWLFTGDMGRLDEEGYLVLSP